MSHALNVIFVTRSNGSVSTEAEVLAKTHAGSAGWLLLGSAHCLPICEPYVMNAPRSAWKSTLGSLTPHSSD
jgi:hypothetical protein